MKPGPKPRSGARYPSGKLKPYQADVSPTMVRRMRDMARDGAVNPHLGTAIGCLYLATEISHAQMAAGMEFARLRARYDRAIDAPRRTCISPSYGAAFGQVEPSLKDGDSGDGLCLVPWGQGFRDMAPAIDALETAVMDRSLVHAGNPVLTWNIANAVSASDPAGNRKIDKSKVRFRIDGAVALAMAIGIKARFASAQAQNFDDVLASIMMV